MPKQSSARKPVKTAQSPVSTAPNPVTTTEDTANSRLAYVMSAFPMLSETFILYEILEMKRLGLTVEIYPLLRKQSQLIHEEAKSLISEVHYHGFVSAGILYAQWYFIRRWPGRYFRTLAAVLRGTLGSVNFFVGALGILPKSVRFAYEMSNMNVTHVHAQFANHAAVSAFIINRLTGIPYSFTARGSDIHKDRTMLCRKLETASFAIAVSEFNKKVIVNECGDRAVDKVHVIYGGIDTGRFSPQRPAEKSNRLQVICVSRFEEVKGQTHLISACGLLRDRGVPFACHLVGDGPLRGRIEKQIQEANLTQHVSIHAPCTQSEVIRRLRSSDVFVLATVAARDGKREGIPNVLKEAMACALPVVASRISGIPELVEDAHSGVLVPPGDSVALADALQRLGDDVKLRQAIGQNGRRRILEDFDLKKSAARRAHLFVNATGAQTDLRNSV